MQARETVVPSTQRPDRHTRAVVEAVTACTTQSIRDHTERAGQAAPASSLFATSPPPAATKAAPRIITMTVRTASRVRPARRGCPTPRTSAYAPRTTTARTHKRAPRALRVPLDQRETPSRVATRRRAQLDRRHCRRRRSRSRPRRHRCPPPPKTRRRRLRRRATRSLPTSPTRD